MSIKSTPNGYEVDCRPCGRRGKRYRKKFKTKSEAQNFERWLIATKNNKDWIDNPKDHRRLTELANMWFHHYGQTLKRGDRDLHCLLNLAKELGNPRAYQVTKALFSDYRARMLKKGIKPATINREHYRLSSVFSALIKIEEYHGENPLKGIAKLKIPANEMGFLSISEIETLLDALDGYTLKIAMVCLATGARWSEAQGLKGSNLASGKATFIDTKNGKNRTVPIRPDLFSEIYTGKNGRIFSDCYREFYDTLKELNFDLPKGQATHVLRHTFASHFMMNGGNILSLQKILGHATITQTMVYAHLAPDYLNEAMQLNPLSTLRPN
ncbi:phage integrase [Vibrio scophthalmi]|uniref:Integrase n=1 Tax=Vibrio scophthalmi TaxID=45658 RepID=A0A1E3WKS0_9VIBR|nr:tyrosine-type recombinase/integrase [Vibrio scophthalmi]ODS10364.1 Integrase [Vibrio scophthalmi]